MAAVHAVERADRDHRAGDVGGRPESAQVRNSQPFAHHHARLPRLAARSAMRDERARVARRSAARSPSTRRVDADAARERRASSARQRCSGSDGIASRGGRSVARPSRRCVERSTPRDIERAAARAAQRREMRGAVRQRARGRGRARGCTCRRRTYDRRRRVSSLALRAHLPAVHAHARPARARAVRRARAPSYARRPSDALRGVRGRHLLDLAGERRGSPRRSRRASAARRLARDRAVAVVGVRLGAEADRRLVDLGLAVDVRQQPRRAAEQQHEQPGRERIERAGVPDASLAERAAATLTTSCEVTPAGLSTSSSAVNRSSPPHRRRRPACSAVELERLALDLREQRLDARGALDARVVTELDLRREAQRERLRPTRERRCAARLASPSNVARCSGSVPITLTKTLRDGGRA